MRKNSKGYPANRHGISLTYPSEVTTTFNELIGLEDQIKELKNLIGYMKNKDSFDMLGVAPCTRVFLSGETGVGKASLVFAIAKETNLPLVAINANFLSNKKNTLTRLKMLFKAAKKLGKSIVLIKELGYVASLEENYRNLFFESFMKLLNESPDVIVFATLSSSLVLPPYVCEEDGFEKEVNFVCPELKFREALFRKFSGEYNDIVDERVDFNRLAKDTYDMTGGDIKKIVKEAVLYANSEGHEKAMQSDFDEIISLMMLGEKRKKMTDKEKLSTAYHEAGHTVAGYFAKNDFELSKVEIVHRTDSMGVTCPDYDEDKLSWFEEDWKGQIIFALGGMAAEKYIYKTTSSGVSEDLKMATESAKLMVQNFGMSEEVGPICLDEDVFFSEEINKAADIEIQNLIKTLFDECYQIMTTHSEELETLAKALFEKEVLSGVEVIKMFKEIEEKRENND